MPSLQVKVGLPRGDAVHCVAWWSGPLPLSSEPPEVKPEPDFGAEFAKSLQDSASASLRFLPVAVPWHAVGEGRAGLE